jgi:hypothetical protein
MNQHIVILFFLICLQFFLRNFENITNLFIIDA